MGKCALVPAEVVLDRRLTLPEIRLLITIFSNRDSATNVDMPDLNAMAEFLAISFDAAYDARLGLEAKGWVYWDPVQAVLRVATPSVDAMAEGAQE